MAQFTGSGSLIVDGASQKVLDCRFNGGPLQIDRADALEIRGCTFNQSGTGIEQIGVLGGAEILVTENFFFCTTMIDGGGTVDNDQWIISSNIGFATDGFVGLYAEQVRIVDNDIYVRGKGIELIATSAGYSVIVTGNTLDGGNIYIEGTDFDILYGGVIVANNAVIPLSTTHGIHLNNCVRVSVHHNHVSSEFDGEDNTHDGVFVEGDSDRNHIEANYIHGNNVLRYGINISAGTCDCNIVVGNVLGDSADYETAPINDAGTDTQWKYPDDPVFGDNFVDCEPTPS